MSEPSLPSATTVNENSAIYYTGQYWNDLPQVVAYMSEHFTGDPGKWWVDDFKERFCREPLGHVLVLNCGNGWVERELVDKGIARSVTAFDYSKDLLEQALRDRGRRAIRYLRADANAICFAPNSFDAVFNVAALHHVQYLDRLCRVLSVALKRSGLLVSFDYIGPHRNRYSYWHWRRMAWVNRTLPVGVRKDPLRRIPLASMLENDPTEAIHSELILSMVARYFDIVERHDTGGGIAYEILTFNRELHAMGAEAAAPYIREILAWDRHYTASGQVPSLFSYFLARPRKKVLDDTVRLRAFQDEEERREARARARGGVYRTRHHVAVWLHLTGVRLRRTLQARGLWRRG